MPNNTTEIFLTPINFGNEAKYDNFTFYEVHLLVLIAIAFLSPVAVVSNALVLAAIWRNVSLRTTSYILLAGLAFTDFCTGLISQPFWAANGFIYLADPQFVSTDRANLPTFYLITRGIGDGCAAYFYQITVLLITIMSIERWMLMSRRSLLSVRRVSFVVVALSLLMVPLTLFLHGKESDLTFVVLVLFCVIVTSVAYFKVFRIIRRHQQQIQVNMSSQNAAQPAINFAKYKKSVFTILYILAVFYICYLPLIVTVASSFLVLTELYLSNLLFNISMLLVFLSSSINPLIVLWRMKDIRDEVVRLLKRVENN